MVPLARLRPRPSSDEQAPVKIARDSRGTAAIEFALIGPVLLLLLGGLGDFALAFWYKGLLASSVAQGASYAAMKGPTVTALAIRGIVGQKLALPASSITVTGPSCYCVSGRPAVKANQVCENPCPGGARPGSYVEISARYTYQPILPSFSKLVSPVLTETAMARLQ